MAIQNEYIQLAIKDVNIVDILKYIENDFDINFNIQDTGTINIRCPYEVFNRESSVHTSGSNSKTSINPNNNTIKCWNPACEANKTIDTIGLIRLFYPEYAFQDAVKIVLEIGGFEYETEDTELSEEDKISILLTNYVEEKSKQLIRGYELIEEDKITTNKNDLLYIDAAKYLISRGIPKQIATKLKLGIGGGDSRIIKETSIEMLKKAKILSKTKEYELMNKRILIPNILKGRVVGITGRAIYNDVTRYLNVGAVKNLINIDNAKKYNKIYLFEGALNAASYMTLTSQDNAMALQGAESFKKEFLKIIIEEKAQFNDETEFIYVADNDTAGIKAAINLGLEILKLGFTLNVLITPLSTKGEKVDTNDILRCYGLEKGKKVWNKFITTMEPFIIFAIKQDISKLDEPNKLILEMKKCKIVQKYLTLDILDPNEKWVLNNYLNEIGLPATKEFFKYANIHFTNKPVIKNNRLVCFIGEINKELKNILEENDAPYNLIDIKYATNFENIDKELEIILISNSLYLLKTKQIYNKLKDTNENIKIFYTDKTITSLLEYSFAINQAISAKEFFNNLESK